MASGKTFVSNIGDFYQSSEYLERIRLYTLLENAVNSRIVAVYAGSGYGKTRAVYSFLQKQEANVTWMQLSERDNIITHFWENYVHMISLNWPDIGARLRAIGFPETDEAFAKYSVLRNKALSSPDKFFFVYDDFHLLHNPVILRVFERIASSIPSNGTVVLLSRLIPEINITGMMLREHISIIREEELCFTEDEIARYFDQLGLAITRWDIRDIYEDTRGWAFAINLIGRSLCKNMKYERTALVAMKDNIFKLIETETLNNISGSLWHFLLRISLIDHLAVDLIKQLANDDTLLLEELNLLNSYIRYDYHMGVYIIHNLFLEYLHQHQHILSDDEKCETYRKAGIWCESNNYMADALAYYEKSGDYDAIMRIVYLYNMQIPENIANLVREIFERMPIEMQSQNQLFPAMHLKVMIALGLFEQTAALKKKYVEEWEPRPESPEKNRALAEIYGIWAIFKIIMCPYTDVYDFEIYFIKQREYYDKNPYTLPTPTTQQTVGSYALLVGTNRVGAPEEFIEAMSNAISQASQIVKGYLYGLDDLARGELFYYRREINNAEQYLKQALDKARSSDQYAAQNRAMLYLMLISFSRGDIKEANHLLQQMEILTDVKEYASRYDSYDIAVGHYYLALGKPEQIPGWLKDDFSPYAHPAFLTNFSNRVKAHYCYQTGQYNKLLAFLENTKEKRILLFGQIVLKVLESLSLYKLKRKEEAIAALTEAYALAEPNKIIVPFIQYSKDMRTLTAAALKDDTCTIPGPWLEDINRKSSAFAKRVAYMISENNASGDDDHKTNLSDREIKVLKDLSQGLSRTEIAASQNISVNTVKMVVNSIYAKLYVTNLHEALRIAITLKLI